MNGEIFEEAVFFLFLFFILLLLSLRQTEQYVYQKQFPLSSMLKCSTLQQNDVYSFGLLSFFPHSWQLYWGDL